MNYLLIYTLLLFNLNIYNDIIIILYYYVLNDQGPYEKMMVPFLRNGIVGTANSQTLVGPGHAAYFNVKSHDSALEEDWRVVFHASIGENCIRYPFIGKFYFGSDDWPYFDISGS